MGLQEAFSPNYTDFFLLEYNCSSKSLGFLSRYGNLNLGAAGLCGEGDDDAGPLQCLHNVFRLQLFDLYPPSNHRKHRPFALTLRNLSFTVNERKLMQDHTL